ncbi:MAG: Gfo/Idh/MocA family oxidoreductase [Chloroflexota bacterium]|nr:Gfo/Idh/MocA family oxidoreductase [Chloroflexota bacterium]
MKESITAVLLGAGQRGADSYGPYALEYPQELRFVAVAEPDPIRRTRFAEAHGIPSERQFTTWEEVASRPQLADALFNCTKDQMHYASTMGALDTGYDVLLEKPMTNRLTPTVQLVQHAEKLGRLLQVCHVLHYTTFFSTLHDILESGKLGDIITVEHRENVETYHMAHSFVRGNWRNAAESSPMILSKCCHDLDILTWNFGHGPERLQSFGSLLHFRRDMAPTGATQRCTDDCPVSEQCPFDARRLYLDMDRTGWPVTMITSDLSYQGRLQALESGPYGRCVFHCDNTVVDHQTVNLEFPGGATAVLFMQGHSHEESRTLRYDGTRATLRGKFTYRGGVIEIHDHVTGAMEVIPCDATMSGHSGGDFGMVSAFLETIRGNAAPLTRARVALESHMMAFAAEESRKKGKVVDMAVFRRRAEEVALSEQQAGN